MTSGRLILSLDFELIWGIFEKRVLHPVYFQKTRDSIPRVLQLFEGHGVNATWATVGMLFNQNWEQWEANRPDCLPQYHHPERDSWRFAGEGRKRFPESCFFAPDLIRRIAGTTGQEIGTHTYSHFYCQEPGQSLEQFAADLKSAIGIAEGFGITLESLVFPRNQFQPDYLEVCAEQGITCVRTNPNAWYWKSPKSDLLSRVARTADSYLPFSPKSVAPESIVEHSGVLLQPASRFLRPHATGPGGSILNRMRTERIKSEMSHAAKQGRVYHLWWHPHNFAVDVEASLKNLEEIMQHFVKLRDEFGMESHSMGSLRDRLAGGWKLEARG